MSKTKKKTACISKEFMSASKRNSRGILHSSLLIPVLISSFLFSCTKFDAQDPDSVTGYNWVDKPETSSMAASSNVGTSSHEEILSSSVTLTSSVTATSSSSVTASSSSIATLNTQTCNYSASSISDGSMGSLTCTDENKTYNTVVIGTQTWMADNLAWLPSVNEASSNSSTVVKYYVYGYSGTDVSAAKSENNYITYGVLYNFPAAIRACPTGWHLPTDAEWTTLENYLGTATVGTQLKSNSTLWKASVYAGTNTSHFSALPGGHYGNIEFADLGSYGVWWTATPMGSSSNAGTWPTIIRV